MRVSGHRPGVHDALLIFAGVAIFGCSDAKRTVRAQAPSQPVVWNQVLHQPDVWYGSPEAGRIADVVLLCQRPSGGWMKNQEYVRKFTAADREKIAIDRLRDDCTLDNGATHTEIAFLARVQRATGRSDCRDAASRGIAYLLKAQYQNGGWPQFWPKPEEYQSRITFNDDATTGALRVLHAIVLGNPNYGFVSGDTRRQAASAVARGVSCILKCQIVQKCQRTGWCAQYDEKTLQPAQARSYEPPSLSSLETVFVLRFLMEIPEPAEPVVQAVEAAIAWLKRVEQRGIRFVRKIDPKLPGGFDRVAAKVPGATGMWARFYEFGTDRPIFSGRDGVVKYKLGEIEHERRVNYGWYVDLPNDLIRKDFPVWRERLRRIP